MAIYHLHDSVVSRGKGQSVVAAAAYQSRTALYNARDGEVKDYSEKAGQELLFSGVYVPKDAPEWARDPEQLWNGVERAEDQHNKTRAKSATLAHRLDIALMAELTPEQNRYALQDFIREQMTRAGRGTQASIHGPEKGGDARNIHAHLLVTIRTLDGDGFSAQKPRLDRPKMREQVNQWRESWAHIAARHLRRHGHEEAAAQMEAGHLTLEEQRQKASERGDVEHAETLKRGPTQHQGPKATRMERGSVQSELGEQNREALDGGNRRKELEREQAEVAREIAALEEQERRKSAEAEASRAFAELARESKEEEQAAWEAAPSPANDWKRVQGQPIETTPTEALWEADRLHRTRLEQPPQTPSNENRPEAHQKQREHVPRTPAARAFEKAQQPEQTPHPEPPRRRTEQRDTFNEAASPPREPPQEQKTRKQGEGGDSQTQAHKPANENKRRPRAQTAEEMRERMKNRSGRKRTRERE